MSTHYGNFLRGFLWVFTPIGWLVAFTFHTWTGLTRLFPKRDKR